MVFPVRVGCLINRRQTRRFTVLKLKTDQVVGQLLMFDISLSVNQRRKYMKLAHSARGINLEKTYDLPLWYSCPFLRTRFVSYKRHVLVDNEGTTYLLQRDCQA